MQINSLRIALAVAAVCLAWGSTEQTYSYEVDNEMPEEYEKRIPHLSVNNNLRSLAAMLKANDQRRAAKDVHSHLKSIGKRGSGYYFANMILKMLKSRRLVRNQKRRRYSPSKRQRLSINGALSTLADMLEAQGRPESMTRERLLELGKRTPHVVSEGNNEFLDDSEQDQLHDKRARLSVNGPMSSLVDLINSNDKSEVTNRLLALGKRAEVRDM